MLIDLDGVIYRGGTALPGIPEFFRTLVELGIRYHLLTNNSTLTTQQFVEKVRGMGVPASGKEMLTSAEATASYLVERTQAGAGVYVIGETGLQEAMRAHGFALDAARPEYVVVGMDRQFTYEKLYRGCNAILAGAGFVGSNPDVTLPTEEGLIPGCGTLLAALQACTGKEPTVIGKPETRMLELAMKRMGVERQATAMLGDRLDTDIIAGANAGVTTIMVLTGISTKEEAADSPTQPDIILEDLPELAAAFRQAHPTGK
ncbi:MAG: HAD-IIA family hydrolase [Dehalococcoidales bacterium]|nr:HAD-IIA family hydrolase [Dehalococcoidales bacterium]